MTEVSLVEKRFIKKYNEKHRVKFEDLPTAKQLALLRQVKYGDRTPLRKSFDQMGMSKEGSFYFGFGLGVGLAVIGLMLIRR